MEKSHAYYTMKLCVTQHEKGIQSLICMPFFPILFSLAMKDGCFFTFYRFFEP